jgi:hypothetical protein
LEDNVNGQYNVAIGAMSNTNSNLSERNTTVGYYSGFDITTGYDNVYLGYTAGENLTTGYQNVVIGSQAMNSATTAYRNVSIGFDNMTALTSGRDNVSVGTEVNNLLTTGSYNVSIGQLSLPDITTGSYNTAVGRYAGDGITTTNRNTFLGYWCDAYGLYDYSVALGYFSSITASYQARVGYTGTTSIGGYQLWSNLSDGRFKNNVQEDVKGIDFIMRLRPVTYNIDQAKLDEFAGVAAKAAEDNDPNYQNHVRELSQITHTGFIAQEVEDAAKDLGYDFDGVDRPQNEKDHYSLRYGAFVVPLVKAMQEQQEMIRSQQGEIQELRELIESLNKRIGDN